MPKTLKRFCAIVTLITASLFVGACSVNEDEPAGAPPPTPQAATSPNQAASTYYGAIDFRDCQFVKGWVYNRANINEEIKVELYLDGQLIETMPAKTLRPDVKAQKLGTGEYGFAFKLPANINDSKSHTVSAKTAGSGFTLNNIPNVSPFQCPPPPPPQ